MRLTTITAVMIVVFGLSTGAKFAQPDEPKAKKIKVGKGLHVHINGKKRKVVLNARVCLREGQLEQFLTRSSTKEHEAILAADADARKIHLALILAGATAGKPVKFRPKYQPASGTTVKITIEYKDKKTGKTIKRAAQDWIRHIKTKKHLKHDWVFAGSQFVKDPARKEPFYAANEGDVICISNFETAMLDLPIRSSQEAADLQFEADTDRIPPLDTPVLVTLEPIPDKKAK